MLPISLIAVLIALAITFAFYKITGLKVFAGMMTALQADGDVPSRENFVYSRPVYQATTIYAGALVCLNSTGYAVPGAISTSLIADGRARFTVDNSLGNSADKYVDIEKGVFRFANSANGDLIGIDSIGDVCWIVDDNTVAKTYNSNTRSIAGVVMDVDASGVWVACGFKGYDATANMVGSNNLSEITTATTARSNIGANLVALTLNVALLNGTATYYVTSPVAGHITKLQAILQGSLTNANATLTGNIASSAITTGVFTLVSGATAGTVYALTPSGTNTVAVGSNINFVVSGSQSAAVGCTVTILITTDV